MADLAGSDRYCIIGAGASGLAIAKNFKQRGIPFDCLEREGDLGGLWNIGTDSGIVYETTHLVSASYSTSYDDLPMGDDMFPPYPNHAEILGIFSPLRGRIRLRRRHRVRQERHRRSRARATTSGKCPSPVRIARASIAAS